MNMPSVILFDLYGTLLDFKQRAFIKALAQVLGLPPRSIAKKLLGDYLTRAFTTPEEMMRDLAQLQAITINAKTIEDCLLIINTHLSLVSVIDEATQLLAFLNACGLRAGLVSNAASTFKTPVFNHGLNTYFDCMIFSCDAGICKPDEKIYLTALQALNVQAQDCLFIGDAWHNDHIVPRSLGMQALWIGKHADPRVKCVERLRDIAWYSFQHQRPLIKPGDTLLFDDDLHCLASLNTLSSGESGKYNIVARAELINKRLMTSRTVYFKRFSLQGSAHLERLAYCAYALVGATACIAGIVDDGEPILITSEIGGRPWDAAQAQALADQIGFQLALAYVFAHTDIRPRNLILRPDENGLHIELIDMEHCFFAAALDTCNATNMTESAPANSLTDEAFQRRIKHQPLGLKALRRVTRIFTAPLHDEALTQFRQGWNRGFESARGQRDLIARLMNSALNLQPCPTIGTRAYRRALTNIDIDLLLRRVDENPKRKLDEILDMQSPLFEYEYVVTMGDVNTMENCYFLKYFELQGHVRELWLKQYLSNCNEVLANHLLSTKSAHCDYKIPFFLYDTIVVRFHVSDLQRVSVNLHFDFYQKGSDILHATGLQQVVCKDLARKTCRMPAELMSAFSKFAR